MKLVIDTESKTLTSSENEKSKTLDLYSEEAFNILSKQWIKLGWNLKYSYTFSWMGRPIIQLPEDMIRLQEVVYKVKPDVIIETGIAHGGSLIYSASLCQGLGKGRVIGIDIEIRPHNRKALEEHPLFPYITLIEGSSTAPTTAEKVKSLIQPGESVFVILDSNHSKQHVLDELETYHSLVTPGSYIVATDGVMKDLHDIPLGDPEWEWNHPTAAAEEFACAHPEFIWETPETVFNEANIKPMITYWPGAWLKRKAVDV